MVVSIQPHAELGRKDHREDAPHFRKVVWKLGLVTSVDPNCLYRMIRINLVSFLITIPLWIKKFQSRPKRFIMKDHHHVTSREHNLGVQIFCAEMSQCFWSNKNGCPHHYSVIEKNPHAWPPALGLLSNDVTLWIIVYDASPMNELKTTPTLTRLEI